MFTISKNLIYKNLLLNILMIIQISICIVLSNAIIGFYNGVFYSYDKSTYFDSITFLKANTDFSNDLINLDQTKLNELGVTIETYCDQFDDIDNGVFTYKEKTMELFRPFLKYGKWFDECNDVLDGAIKTVIISNDKSLVGNYHVRQIGKYKCTFYVCGSFGPELFYFATAYGGGHKTSQLMPRFSANGGLRIGYFCEYKNKPSFVKDINLCAFAYIPEDKKVEALEYLTPYISGTSKLEINRETDLEEYNQIKIILEPFLLSFGVLGVITMVCMLVLNIKRHQPLFVDFYKIGMRKKHILQVALWYTLFLVAGIFIFSILIGLGLGKLILNDWVGDTFLYGMRNNLFNLGFVLVLFLLTSIISLILFRKRSVSNE